MSILRNQVDTTRFNDGAVLPYELRREDFHLAMQDVYDFFFDVNTALVDRGLERLDDLLRPAIMSELLSDMLTASLAKHSRSLVVNTYFNGHPDLVVKGRYPENSAKAGEFGAALSGADPASFDPSPGDLKLRPDAQTGTEADLNALLSVNLDGIEAVEIDAQ